MKTKTNAEIARSLNLWDEYFNVNGLLSDAEFYAMSIEQRLAMLNGVYPDNDESEI